MYVRFAALAALISSAAAWAQSGLPPELEGVGVTEQIGRTVDLELQFTEESGYPAPLRRYFHQGRPVILNLVYYSCPMLCNLLLNGQTAALRQIPGSPGADFEIVTVSIDPSETFDLARRKRAVYLESYGRPAPGWHFLADYQGNVKKLAEQVGFRYSYDARTRQYAHAAAVMILTPEGKVSRYLYGVQFKPLDLRLALAEAGRSKTRLSVDRLLLYCFHYDPQARSYVLFATNFMRAGGVLSVLALGTVLYRLWRREARQSKGAGGEVSG